MSSLLSSFPNGAAGGTRTRFSPPSPSCRPMCTGRVELPRQGVSPVSPLRQVGEHSCHLPRGSRFQSDAVPVHIRRPAHPGAIPGSRRHCQFAIAVSMPKGTGILQTTPDNDARSVSGRGGSCLSAAVPSPPQRQPLRSVQHGQRLRGPEERGEEADPQRQQLQLVHSGPSHLSEKSGRPSGLFRRT